jgi:hypothetical protein
MSGTGGPPRQSFGTDNPLVGRIDGWSHKRREAPDRTPPIDRLTIAPMGRPQMFCRLLCRGFSFGPQICSRNACCRGGCAGLRGGFDTSKFISIPGLEWKDRVLFQSRRH